MMNWNIAQFQITRRVCHKFWACKFIIESIVLSLTWLFPSNEDAQFVNSCARKPYWRVCFHEIGLHYDTVCPFLLKGFFFIKTNGSYLICTCRHKNPSEMCRLLGGNLEFILVLWRLGWPSKEKDPMPSAIVYELKKKKSEVGYNVFDSSSTRVKRIGVY